MKIFISIILVIVCWASLAIASPRVVCDPQTGVTHYKLTGPAWVPETAPAIADGSMDWDVASAPVGTTDVTVRACRTVAPWPEVCSETVPFSFTRPAPPASVGNIQLLP